MLDMDTEKTAIDSLLGANTKSDEEILQITKKLGLSMSPLFFREVSKCLAAESLTPSYELLYFFDAIFSVSTNDPKNITVSELSSGDREIMKTFIDVCEKSSYVQKNPEFPISDALSISSEYLSTLGVKTPSSVDFGYDLSISDPKGNALVSLGFNNKEALPYGYVNEKENTYIASEYRAPSKSFLPEGTEIFLFSGNDIDFYRFCNSKEFSEVTLTNTKVGSKGLLHTLLDLCFGAEIDLSGLSGKHTLCDLVSSFKGYRLVAVKKDACDLILPVAEIYGIHLLKIATALSFPTVKMITNEGQTSIRSGFLVRMLFFEEKTCVKIESEQIAPTKYEKLTYTADGATGILPSEAIEIKDHLISARYTSGLSFGDGINTVLDSLFSLLAKGVDRRHVGITVKISARRQNLCAGLSALLGVYRTVMELCLPQINSEIVFSDDEYILCSAFAKKDTSIRPLRDFFIEVRKVYLLSFKRFDDSMPKLMPDFDGIRKMCDYLYSVIKDGTVLTAHALNGAVSTVTGSMNMINETKTFPEDTVAQGFIIEALSFKDINAPLIGMMKREQNQ